MPQTGPLALAVDIGGTKLASVLVDANGVVRDRRVTATPATASAGELWDALVTVLPVDRPLDGLVGVGIASAGPLDAALGTVSPVNIGAWRDFPLVAHISERFPARPISLLGDAVAAAVGELATEAVAVLDPGYSRWCRRESEGASSSTGG